METIVCVVAHPDDLAHGMGGTAWLLKDRYRLHVICASRGDRGYYTWKGVGLPPPNAELAARRSAEEQAVCTMLGATLTFLDLMDGEIYAERPAVERVAQILRELRPVAVFTLGPQEKPDHAAAYLIALQALYLAERFWDTELYMMMRHSETRQGHYADLYVDITAVIAEKRRMVACHQSQNPTPEHIERVMERNVILGKLAWCEHAEAFMTGMPLMALRKGRKAGCVLLELGRASS
ncbi:MAG: PIG-L deacetylase family protein [Planctomycetota bacterium]